MSEWWTYTLSDLLMFSPRTYWRLLELYNRAVWPAHVATLAGGVVVLALLWSGRGRAAAALLAGAWAWVAWGFLYSRYATINTAGTIFTSGFAAQAALLLTFGVTLRHRNRTGLYLVAFALFAQPLIGPLLAGRPWAQAEVFGLAPDPTVVATLGAALQAVGAARWLLLLIPVLWCLVTGATLWAMGEPDALIAPAAAILAVLAVAAGPKKAS